MPPRAGKDAAAIGGGARRGTARLQRTAGGGARPQWKPWPQPVDTPVTDTQRLDWMLPLMSLADDPNNLGGPRTKALAAALVLGKTGRDAIDYAMEGSP